MLASVAIVIAGARAHVYRPVLAFRETIARFDRQRSVRVAEAGALEIRQLARSFNKMADALEKQRAIQLSFLAGIAHDLRNPLGVMKNSLSALPAGAGRSDERLAATMAVIARQVDLLVRMVSDLLETAQIEAGRFDMVKQRCDARAVVVHAVELFRFASPRHELVAELPGHELSVEWDPLRMEQVVNNLVSNAIKYSPAGGHIHVGVEPHGNEILVRVRDEGIGIPHEEQRTIFEPFHRGARSRDSIAGVGLGLSTAQRIVEAHGGGIEVDSALGRGSTFRVSIPADGASPNARERQRQ